MQAATHGESTNLQEQPIGRGERHLWGLRAAILRESANGPEQPAIKRAPWCISSQPQAERHFSRAAIDRESTIG